MSLEENFSEFIIHNTGKKIYVNPYHIISFEPRDADSTFVKLTNGNTLTILGNINAFFEEEEINF